MSKIAQYAPVSVLNAMTQWANPFGNGKHHTAKVERAKAKKKKARQRKN